MNSLRISTTFFSVLLLVCGGLGCSPDTHAGMSDRDGVVKVQVQIAALQNKAGKFVAPSIESGQKALATVAMPDDMIVWAADPEGDDSYPIVTYTWIMAFKKYTDAKRGNAVKDLLAYCLADKQQKESAALGYIPLPPAVSDKVKAALANIAVEGNDKGAVALQGAGATFPAPLYRKWFRSYCADHPDADVDYQPVGSGPGIKAFLDNTIDFGASDSAMTPEDMSTVAGGVQLLPMTAGSIVLAYNLPGVDNLKLTREAYLGIFLGKVRKWSDKAIADANPGAKLPDTEITLVVRADRSGTTFELTKHLSAISEDFKKSPGVSDHPKWPVETKSAKGTEGVALLINSTPGSIGYVEFGYVKK